MSAPEPTDWKALIFGTTLRGRIGRPYLAGVACIGAAVLARGEITGALIAVGVGLVIWAIGTAMGEGL